MSRFRTVGVVFRKDLVDALRDRRTLAAMVLVPIVLYPALLVIVVQALRIQRTFLEKDQYRIAVPNQAHVEWLEQLLKCPPGEDEARDAAPGHTAFRAHVRNEQFVVHATAAEPTVCLNDLRFHAYVRVEPEPSRSSPAAQQRVTIWYDAAELPSNVAQTALSERLDRYAGRLIEQRLAGLGVSPDVLTPVKVELRSSASPQKVGGALLGQIMPFLLIIITITGAIYPAIDLTAGERERGTLETLLSAPVPVMHIVAGKFLAILTITLVISLLNLVSIGATVTFGGLGEVVARATPGGGVTSISPASLAAVLVAMIPTAVLFAAVLLAACSFARTFKEAQNYMMPVMIVVMVPALIVSYMPTLQLHGVLAVLPVANVVALIRELFLGKYDVTAIGMVMGSTLLYALAAVFAAARLFGQEAVLFTDVGSYRTLLQRRFFRPRLRPSSTAALVLPAVVFPVQFLWQSAMIRADTSPGVFRAVIVACQLLCFAAPPLLLAWYLRADLRETFSFRAPSAAASAGTALVALGVAPLMVFLRTWQERLVPLPPDAAQAAELEQRLLLAGPAWIVVACFGVLPGVCEELLFRGFVLSGLRARLRPAGLCLAVGLLFGLFHLDVFKIGLTTLLGALLCWLCWRSGSILPACVVHIANNGVMLAGAKFPELGRLLGQQALGGPNAPPWVVPASAALTILGIAIIARSARPTESARAATLAARPGG